MKRLLSYFQKKNNVSAALAKERLQIIISHERTKNNRPNLLANMQQELIEVIAKHLKMDPSLVKDQVKLDLAQNQLELNIMLPDEELSTAG